LKEDNCNNVPKQTKLSAEQQREYRENKTPQAGNSHAAYMREYRTRLWLKEENFNNVPKRTKLNAEQQCEYRETHKNISAENMHNYRKCKAQENA
jgi:hypothetical protein